MLDFAATVLPMHPVLMRYCWRLLGNREDAEDAAQVVIMRAWRAWDGRACGTTDEAEKWLYRIARNECIDEARRRAVRPQSAFGYEDVRSAGPQNVERVVCEREAVGEVIGALATLEPQHEWVLWQVGQGVGYADLAVGAGCSYKAMKSRVAYARQRLRRRVGR